MKVSSRCLSPVHPTFIKSSRSEQVLWQGDKCFHLSICKVLFQSEKSLKLCVLLFQMASFLLKHNLELLLNFWKSASFYENMRSAKLTAFPAECQLSLFSVYMEKITLEPALSLTQLINPPAVGLDMWSCCSVRCVNWLQNTQSCASYTEGERASKKHSEGSWGSMWLHNLSCWMLVKLAEIGEFRVK